MKVKTHLLAFKEDKIRMVEIPDETGVSDILDQTFVYGQNDFQPQRMPSLSVGDVIELKDEYHLIRSVDFRKITSSEFESYKAIPMRDRFMSVCKTEEAEWRTQYEK